MGCIMMRVCHLDTCPVGVATQNPELRRRFTGKPEHVVNFMRFIAQDVREHMAALGVRTLDELVGRTDKLLAVRQELAHRKAQGLDLSPLLYRPDVGPKVGRTCTQAQEHGWSRASTSAMLLDLCAPALEHGAPVEATLPIRNVHRTVGTRLGGELPAATARPGCRKTPSA
jgi:hypothetical protein